MDSHSEPVPTGFRQKFIQVLAGDLALIDFEEWLYKAKGLEKNLPEKVYLSLLELDYKSQSAFYELYELLGTLVDIGSVEAYELLKLIGRLEAEGSDFPEALQECYDLYTDGCYFLETLGLNWGLMLRVPPAQYNADSWNELSDSEKAHLFTSLDLDQIRREVSLFRKWIEKREIIVIRRPNEFPRFECIDRRPTEDKSNGKSKI